MPEVCTRLDLANAILPVSTPFYAFRLHLSPSSIRSDALMEPLTPVSISTPV